MFQQMLWIEVLLWKLCSIVEVWITAFYDYCWALSVKFLVITGNRGLMRCFEFYLQDCIVYAKIKCALRD